MTKTHAEFLKELKEDLIYTIENYRDESNDFQRGKIDAYETFLTRIEQFEAEQKQVKDE